jgi:microcystin-dependent protein
VTSPDYTNNTGTGISFDLPITLPSALGEVSAAIATGVAVAGEPDPISVRRRWAVITAIHPEDSTVSIDLGGVIIPHVSYDATYHPALDEVVQVNVVDTDITVIGPTANSLYVSYVRRTGTIVKVNTSGSAPGAPTSVNVTLSDAQVPQTILNVPFVSPYVPSVGDDVMLGQGTNTNVYLVLGAVNRMPRRPTGDIEPSLSPVAKPNTLLCQGQTLSRTTYAPLWAWAQINGLVGAATTVTTDFEDGGTLFVGPNWTQTNTTDRAASGTRSLLLTRANATSGNGYVSQARTVTAGRTYVWSFSAYASSAILYGCAIQLTHSNGSSFRLVSSSFTPAAANAWYRYTFTFAVPAGYTSATIFINDDFITPTSGTTLTIDDLSLYTNNNFLFTTGDGSTTFTIPDFRGRFPVGAGSLGPDSYSLGQIGGHRGLSILTAAQLPQHDHNVSVADHAAHDHTLSTVANHQHSGGTDNGDATGADHSHGGTALGTGHGHTIPYAFGGSNATLPVHNHGRGGFLSEGPNDGVNGAGFGIGGGDHSHGVSTTINGLHTHGFLTNAGGGHTHDVGTASGGTHTVNEFLSGGPATSDLRPSFLAINWLIWI